MTTSATRMSSCKHWPGVETVALLGDKAQSPISPEIPRQPTHKEELNSSLGYMFSSTTFRRSGRLTRVERQAKKKVSRR